MDRIPYTEDSFFSLRLAECSDLRVRGQWWQVPTWHSRSISCGNVPRVQMPSHRKYKALQSNKRGTRAVVHLTWRCCWGLVSLCPVSELVPKRKKRWIIVSGDSLRKGAEAPIFRVDPLLWNACCLPGAWVNDWKRKLPAPVQPSGYHPLLIFLGRQWWSCNKKLKVSQERLLGLGLTS